MPRHAISHAAPPPAREVRPCSLRLRWPPAPRGGAPGAAVRYCSRSALVAAARRPPPLAGTRARDRGSGDRREIREKRSERGTAQTSWVGTHAPPLPSCGGPRAPLAPPSHTHLRKIHNAQRYSRSTWDASGCTPAPLAPSLARPSARSAGVTV